MQVDVTVYLPRLIPAPWMAQAACKGMDPALFFTDRGAPWRNRAACATHQRDLWTEPGDVRLALAFCAGCEVRAECLAEGIDADRLSQSWARKAPAGTYPIYGGFTAAERSTWAATVSAAPSPLAAAEAAAG